MAATTPADSQALESGDVAPRPMRQFAMAVGLYLLWGSVAWISEATGRVNLGSPAILLLLTGIAATNTLFFGIARSRASLELAPGALAAAQSILGISWAATFTLLARGDGHLGLGMFACATLYALFQVPQRSFLRLAAVATISYGGVTVARHWLGWGNWVGESLNLATFVGLMAWLTVFAGYLDSLRRQLQDRNAELRQHIRKVARIAERDHLTKSFNRKAIMESLTREKGRADRSNAPVSVCILDLDHFKALNDAHGHLVGDRVLRQFAKRARAELRAMDAVQPCGHRRSLGRFGGEEFIAILPGTGLAGAAACAERMREAVDEHPFDELYRVTVSIGVAEYRRGEMVPEWLARADDALYEAKAEGRNRVVMSGTPRVEQAEVRQFRPISR